MIWNNAGLTYYLGIWCTYCKLGTQFLCRDNYFRKFAGIHQNLTENDDIIYNGTTQKIVCPNFQKRLLWKARGYNHVSFLSLFSFKLSKQAILGFILPAQLQVFVIAVLLQLHGCSSTLTNLQMSTKVVTVRSVSPWEIYSSLALGSNLSE